MGLCNTNGYKNEKKIEEQGGELTAEQMRYIMNQMETSLCRIIINNNSYGSGFFCFLPFPDNLNLLKVLITNHHVLGENDLLPGKEIIIRLNGDKISKTIKITESRRIYTSPLFDVTIVEIQPYDNIEEYSFMKIDENIFTENYINEYKMENIYLIHYPKGNIAKHSGGVIKSMSEDNKYNIGHLCSTTEGSSGCPILLQKNYKIIGVHKGASEYQNYNVGTLLKGPIEEFIKKFEVYLVAKKSEKRPVEPLKIIEWQMKYTVVNVRIFGKYNNLFVSGFFCKIPINNKMLPVLITSSNFKDEITDLNVFINDTIICKINIVDHTRVIYRIECLYIIEIKPEDNLDISTFEEVSKEILINQDSRELVNKKIYIIMYLENKISYDFGKITHEGYLGRYILYFIETGWGSGGAPIFDKETNKILGIHLGKYPEDEQIKVGILFSEILKEI